MTQFAIYITISLILITAIITYILIKRKKYTRERFAFFSTSLIMTYSITVISHIFGDTSLIKILLISYNYLPFEDVIIYQTYWADKFWSLLFLLVICSFAFLMFKHWGNDGKISKKDKELRDVKKELNFLQAALIGMKPTKIECITPTPKASNETRYDLSYLDTARDWPSEALELLNMFDKQYHINKEDWFVQNKCYLGEFLGKKLIVHCCNDEPSKESIIDILRYFSENLNISNSDFLVVIISKNNTIKSKKITIDDVDIKSYTKDYLLDNLIDFTDYNSYLHEQFYTKEIYEGDKYTLDDVYTYGSGVITEIKATEEKEKEINNVESYLLDWSKSKNNEEQIALLGDYGQGKSVLSLKLANELIKSEIDKQPIIIELRGKSPRNMPMDELVAAWAYRLNYNVKSILTLIKEGKIIVILEGFDELDMVGDKLRRLEHFKKLWEFARYKKSKVIITGRPNLFLNNEEARDYLQLDNKGTSTFHVKAIKLLPFNKEKIEKSLRTMPVNIKTEILLNYDKYGKNHGFSDLVSRPSTLFQASIIWESLDKSNLNSSTIINSFIDHAYKRQAEKLLSISGTNLESPVLTPKERAYFMLGIAVGMIKISGYSNQISGRNLSEIVESLFLNIPEECSQDHHSSSLPLRVRLENDAFDSVYNDVRTSGVLVRDLTSHDSFKFAHKSFLESLFATFFTYKIKPNSDYEKIKFNTISSALDINDVYNLLFSDEVISHITENLINKEEEFSHKESKELLCNLSKRSIVIDKLFFKKYLKLSIANHTMLWSLVIFIYLAITRESKSYSIDYAMLISFSAFTFIMLDFAKTAFTTKLDAPVKIWCRACKVHKYDYLNSKILSKKFINFNFNNDLIGIPGIVNLILKRKISS